MHPILEVICQYRILYYWRTGSQTNSLSAAIAKAHPGRPTVLATKNTLHIGEPYTLLPAHTLLWALG